MKLKTKTLLRMMLLLPFLALEIACGDKTEACLQDDGFTEIYKGELSGNGTEKIDKSNLVIKNQSEWSDLMNQMKDSIYSITDNFKEINIDFGNYMIIAVFDEIKQTGGHFIDIVDITCNRNKIVISVRNLKKGDDTNVITQPFHIIKIPRTEKQITFD